MGAWSGADEGGVGDSRELKASLERLVRSFLPELNQLVAPIRARVTRVYGTGGKHSDEAPTYCVDVQPLRPDGSDDANWPALPRLDLPVALGGHSVGVASGPAVGQLVRVGFEYGDRSRPFVMDLLANGEVPPHASGDLVIWCGETRFTLDRDGTVKIDAAKKVVVDGPEIHLGGEEGSPVVRQEDLLAALNALTLPVSGATAGPAAPQLTEVQVAASPKVKSE